MNKLMEIMGGIGCDIVTGVAAFPARMGKIYAIISNEDDSRLITHTILPKKGDAEIVVTGRSYHSVKRIDTVTLTGTSGTADIICNGVTQTITWDAGGLTATAAAFVAGAAAAAFLASGVVMTSSGAVLYFTAVVAGTNFTGTTSGANATGDLAGTAATATANVLCALNDNKMIIPDHPVTSITPGKGSFIIYYANG